MEVNLPPTEPSWHQPSEPSTEILANLDLLYGQGFAVELDSSKYHLLFRTFYITL
jgi:hypothetical protein